MQGLDYVATLGEIALKLTLPKIANHPRLKKRVDKYPEEVSVSFTVDWTEKYTKAHQWDTSGDYTWRLYCHLTECGYDGDKQATMHASVSIFYNQGNSINSQKRLLDANDHWNSEGNREEDIARIEKVWMQAEPILAKTQIGGQTTLG